MTGSVLAWHFAPADLRCAHDGRRIRVGQTLTVTGTPVLCERGLHASIRVLDALGYAPDPTRLCRVRVGGDVVIGSDKIAGTRRTVLWSLTQRQTDAVLREFACRVAEDALRAAHVTDERSWTAIRVAREYQAGRATKQELAAAWAAAWAAGDAAWAAAGAAAWAAAWAAWDAARAAGDAARDAAWAAAGAAARAAAWAAQSRRLSRLATAEHRGTKP